MKGLVLQGGGAKGAYQVGAIKALNERNIYFDAVFGTSIGAINGAFYVVRNFRGLNRLWLSLDTKDLFDIDPNLLLHLNDKSFKKEDIKDTLKLLKIVLKNRGLDTNNMKRILGKSINENRFKTSKIDFGFNTFSLSNFKELEFYKKDITDGKLVEHLISSAYLPFFKLERIIDDKYYLDGGLFHTDCPIDMAINYGCDEIYVIKLWQKKIKYNNTTNAKIHIVTPRENLGSIMLFETNKSEYRMNLGYYDMVKYLDKLDGNKYYLKKYSEEYYSGLFDKVTYNRMIKIFNRNNKPKSYKEFIIKVIERVCIECNINRFKVYNMPYLITKLKYKLAGKKKSEYYDFIKNIKVDFED